MLGTMANSMFGCRWQFNSFQCFRIELFERMIDVSGRIALFEVETVGKRVRPSLSHERKRGSLLESIRAYLVNTLEAGLTLSPNNSR